MKTESPWPIRLTGGLIAAAMIGCYSAGPRTEQLLKDLSFHIVVNDEQPVPSSGTFAFETKVFKIDYAEHVDLAALDARVVGALVAELERKGYTAESAAPDLLVSYAVALDAPLSEADLNEAYADEFPVEVPEPPADQELSYHQGALIVDVVDAGSRKLLWRGAVMAEVGMDVSEEEKDRRVRLGVQILLSHFPAPIVAERVDVGPDVPR